MKSRAVLCALVLTGAAGAQETFAEAYQRAEGLRAGSASAVEVREAYRQALDVFLALPLEQRSDPGWLPAAAFSAFLAESAANAALLFEQSMAAGNRDAFHAEHLIRALLASGQGAEMLRAGHDLESAFSDAVHRVLIEEGALHQVEAWRHGDRWLRSGSTELGLWVFATLVRASEGDANALANHALALRHVGKEADCEAMYRRALELAPGDARLWNDLGLFLKGAGRRAEAAAAFSASRRLEGEAPTGAATVNLLLLGGEEKASTEALSVVLAARPDAALARRVCLDLLARRGGPVENR